MAVSKSLMYWEEEGVNCYEQSYDNPILETTESYITLAIGEFLSFVYQK